MGMLGHQNPVPPAAAASTGADSEIDEETKQLNALQEKLCVPELIAETTGGIRFRLF